MISLAYIISYCLSAHHNPEFRSVICTGVTLFAPVLHLNCTALSQSESSNFFMCIITVITVCNWEQNFPDLSYSARKKDDFVNDCHRYQSLSYFIKRINN